MRLWFGPRPTRRQVITLAVYALVLIGIVGGRGWFLARALGGRYAVSCSDHPEYRQRLRRFFDGATS